MAAKRSSLWFGYLDAGAKGSLVVRDHSIDTGTPATIYLFNLAKGRILEYRRDIAEPKLRELTDEERDRVKELRKAFENARNGFMPRATVRSFRPSRKVKPGPGPGVPDFESDDDPPLPDKDQEDETVELETD